MDVRDYFATILPLPEEDGGGFVAYLPDLPGCIGDGDTPETALDDVYTAAEAWMDAQVALGREIPAPNRAIDEARDRQTALIRALQTALSMLDQSEGRISDLEHRVHHLIALMNDDRKSMSLNAIADSTGAKKPVQH